jgi:hypothetical protein
MRKGFLGVAGVLVALGIASSPASASERVLDGSFDAVTACAVGDCTSPVWGEGLAGGAGVGPLCEIGTGSCGHFQGPGQLFAHSGTKWAQMGGETTAAPTTTYAVQQVVNIPVPSTLRFQLMRRDSSASTGALTIQLDGIPVYAIGAAEAAYAPISVDLSAFDDGLQTLRFEVIDTNTGGSTDSFNVDDVSIDDAPGQATPAVKKCGKRKKLRHGHCVKKRPKKH